MRIILMLMVVLLHYFSHGGLLYKYDFGSINDSIVWAIESFIFMAVGCFVLLTGYFAIDYKIKLSKVFRIWMQLFFYSVLGFLILIFYNKGKMDFKLCLYAFTPATSSICWFATRYLIFYCMLPILNIIIININKINHIILIIVSFIMISIGQTFFFWQSGNFNDLFYFSLLYFIASFIRKYNVNFSKRICIIGYILSNISLFLFRYIIGSLSLNITGALHGESVFFTYYSPLVLLSAVFFFCFFKNLKIKSLLARKTIVYIAPLSFGVYLLHDNIFVRDILWSSIGPARLGDNSIFIILSWGCFISIIIFVIGILFEFIRSKIYSLTFFKLEKVIDNVLEKLIASLRIKIGE